MHGRFIRIVIAVLGGSGMAVLGYRYLRMMFPELDEEQYQPAGVDLRLGRMFELEGDGELLEGGKKKILPEYEEVEPVDGVYLMEPGKPYVWELEPEIEIPVGAVAFFLPRSTLVRSGVSVHAGLGDPGFKGKIRVLAVNYHDEPYRVEEGARVVQAVFVKAKETKAYDGDYLEE